MYRPPEPGLLPQFLHTIIQRPDLASRIATLQLGHEDGLASYSPQVENLLSLFELTVSNHYFPPPFLPNDWDEDWLSGRRLKEGWGRELRKWLTSFVLVLAARLQSLLLVTDKTPQFHRLQGMKLPTLCTIGSMAGLDFHFNDLTDLYAEVPHLELSRRMTRGSVL